MQELDRQKLVQFDERMIYEVISVSELWFFYLILFASCSSALLTPVKTKGDFCMSHLVQHGREPVDVDFCSITIDRGLDNDILQQQLHAVAKQREELQHMEIELRAQAIARSEIVGMQNNFDTQIKEHANANAKLQVLHFLLVYIYCCKTCINRYINGHHDVFLLDL